MVSFARTDISFIFFSENKLDKLLPLISANGEVWHWKASTFLDLTPRKTSFFTSIVSFFSLFFQYDRLVDGAFENFLFIRGTSVFDEYMDKVRWEETRGSPGSLQGGPFVALVATSDISPYA